MNEKRLVTTIVIFVLMWVTAAGGYLNSGNEQLFEKAYLIAAIDLLIISLITMCIPCIVWLINHRELEYKKGKRLCLWNSIVVSFVSGVLFVEFGFTAIGGLGAIAFYFINKWIFVSDKPSVEEVENISNDIFTYDDLSVKNNVHSGLNRSNGYNIYGSDIVLVNDEDEVNTVSENMSESIAPVVIEEKNCSNGRIKTVFLVLLVILLGVTIGATFYYRFKADDAYSSIAELEATNKTLSQEISVLESDVTGLKKDITSLKNELEICYREINFIDEFVVFVEDDGTNWYHKYQCSRFRADSFWAYNIDAALAEGYKPCPYCRE